MYSQNFYFSVSLCFVTLKNLWYTKIKQMRKIPHFTVNLTVMISQKEKGGNQYCKSLNFCATF